MTMKTENMHGWKVGDRITFRAICRWPTRKVTRVVNGFSATDWPTVRYEGTAAFVVRPSEISAVHRKGE
jgi:hypothetical protein